jgi:DNA-binding Lrp family transcriptional regulator
MTVYERQNKILIYLKQEHFSTVKELSKIVWASESSVRRDLKVLEQKGYIKQIYGGVVLSEYENSVVPVALRDSYNSQIKESLAQQASKYFFDGATVFMDGSSTVRRIIKYIGNYGEIAMNYPDEESRIVKYTLAISPQKTGELIYVTKFVSISEVDSSVSGRKIVTVEFKVPENAKSGFLKVRGDIVSFLPSGFSDEKLIIVDENGNEITE